MQVIPKKAYYIWIGDNKKPEIFNRCYNSWLTYLKDYEIIEINENNFDIEYHRKKNKFFNECFEKKLWAYCSDYIRTVVLYDNGGIYLDIDMELLKPIDDYLSYDFFIGYESSQYLGVGLYGASKNSIILKKLLEFYEEDIYNKALWTIPKILTNLIFENNFDKLDNILLLEKEYFYPFGLNEKFSKSVITNKTVAIHWWNASWSSLKNKLFLETKHLKGIKKIMKKIKIVLRVYLKGY